MSRRPRRAVARLVAALALVVAACSGDETDSADRTTTSSDPTTQSDPATAPAAPATERPEVVSACEVLGELLTSPGAVSTGDVDALAAQLTTEADAIDAWIAVAEPELGDSTDPLAAAVRRLSAANELFRAAIAQLEGVDDVEEVSVAGDMAMVAAAERLVGAGAAVNGSLGIECFPGAGSVEPPDDPVRVACQALTRSIEDARARVQESTVGSVRAWVVLTLAAHEEWAAAVGSRPPDGVDPAEWQDAVDTVLAGARDLFGRAEAVVADREDSDAAGDEVIESILSAPETERAFERYRDAAVAVNGLLPTEGACFEGL